MTKHDEQHIRIETHLPAEAAPSTDFAAFNDALNTLFAAAWASYTPHNFEPVLSRSLAYFCAYEADQLVGFVNLAWDGGIHAFLLDTTVHPDFQRRGIGLQLVKAATETARECGIEWVHVDYEPHLETFYRQCGFRPTLAGLMQVKIADDAGIVLTGSG